MDYGFNLPRPSTNELLTDLYQITMTYSYFKQGRHNIEASFEAFFRKAPFKGKFTVFAGLQEVVNYVKYFKFKEDQLAYLKECFPHWTEDFFDYLRTIDGSSVKIYGIKEGSLVFPKAPVVRLEGPLAFLQILETPILNLINFPTLIATNARRMKLAVDSSKLMIEFGLRRAQGPDGAMMATEYSYLGGFHGTSNVAAGKAYKIPIYGTMAHAYISSFRNLDEIRNFTLEGHNLKELVLQVRKEMDFENTNEGELAAFISYACDHPQGFLALVDTYNSLYSGVPNFVAVAIALKRIGVEPRGIRLDSGDLAQLSKDARKFIDEQGKKFGVDLTKTSVFASNDINEGTLQDLKQKGHAITAFGIGTNLVTCQAQPALGMVYKLVHLENEARIKFSEEIDKIPIPGKKVLHRLWAEEDGHPVVDVLALPEEVLEVGKPVYLRDIADKTLALVIKPAKIEIMQELAWSGSDDIKLADLKEAREHCEKSVASFNPAVLDLIKPETYKVLQSQKLFKMTEEKIEENQVWKEIKH